MLLTSLTAYAQMRVPAVCDDGPGTALLLLALAGTALLALESADVIHRNRPVAPPGQAPRATRPPGAALVGGAQPREAVHLGAAIQAGAADALAITAEHAAAHVRVERRRLDRQDRAGLLSGQEFVAIQYHHAGLRGAPAPNSRGSWR